MQQKLGMPHSLKSRSVRWRTSKTEHCIWWWGRISPPIKCIIMFQLNDSCQPITEDVPTLCQQTNDVIQSPFFTMSIIMFSLSQYCATRVRASITGPSHVYDSKHGGGGPLLVGMLRLEVSSEIHLTLECSPADLAAKWLVTRVFPTMCDEIRGLAEGFSAHQTFMWFLAWIRKYKKQMKLRKLFNMKLSCQWYNNNNENTITAKND